MPKVAILIPEPLRSQHLKPETLKLLSADAELILPPNVEKVTVDIAAEMLPDADVCMSSWGTPKFDEALLSNAPKLKLIAHAAGSVKGITSDAVWNRGIRVTSAANSNGVDVAHYTVALMVLTMKNAFVLRDIERGVPVGTASGRSAGELYKTKVGIVGASHIGRKVISLLITGGYGSEILLYDPYINRQQASELGVTLVEDLKDLMAASDIVSLHAPAIPETEHMINASNLVLMKDGAILINTARGALIDENALISELERGRIFACLDVTRPEPCAADSPLRTLPNVFLTPHIAGALNQGRARMGESAAAEIISFLNNRPLTFEVTRDMLPRIA